MTDDPLSRVQAAYAVLKRAIDERFPYGRFVAIAGGKLVANAESIEGLKNELAALCLTLADVAIDQAGVVQEFKYLGWITTEATIGHWIECVLPTSESSPTTQSEHSHESSFP
jgi:hypothetical protein